ncbi:MAG: deoxyribodipyrimidine photo-lyase [Bacteroidota bacterium]|nr:deoxyribodipyrimidine photo-lyase [Bacteroidota bacterium]
MDQGNKILFWFRESLCLEGTGGLCKAVADNSEIIPVFCFDPRERDLVKTSFLSAGYLQDQIRSAAALRNELVKRGSNLLVVAHPYEKIIPSLARVLKVTQVITNQLSEPEISAFPELTAFRNQKAREVSQLLGMHSIPVYFEAPGSQKHHLPASFPRFPEINPGRIPSK